MTAASRRAFLLSTGAAAFAAGLPRAAAAAMGPNDKFDLVIKGGDVIDPSQSLRGKRDIGIRYGLIEAVEADIPADKALRVMDASGKVVTPGLIDLHSHVYPYGSAIGIPADELVAIRQQPHVFPRGMLARTILQHSGVISRPSPGHASMLSCILQMPV